MINQNTLHAKFLLDPCQCLWSEKASHGSQLIFLSLDGYPASSNSKVLNGARSRTVLAMTWWRPFFGICPWIACAHQILKHPNCFSCSGEHSEIGLSYTALSKWSWPVKILENVEKPTILNDEVHISLELKSNNFFGGVMCGFANDIGLLLNWNPVFDLNVR